MIGVTPDTWGRGAGEGRQNPTGAVEAATAQYRWSSLSGEPDAVKAARPGSGRGGWKRDNHSSDVDHTRWPPTSIVRAAALHVFGDVGASVAVVVASVIILLTGWTLADPLLSVGIAGLIAFGAWRILRETTDILLEAVPKDINLSELVHDMMRVKGVQDVHDLHVCALLPRPHR